MSQNNYSDGFFHFILSRLRFLDLTDFFLDLGFGFIDFFI